MNVAVAPYKTPTRTSLFSGMYLQLVVQQKIRGNSAWTSAQKVGVDIKPQ